MSIVTAVTLNAQVFTEYFEDATVGMNLEDYNGWYVSPKAADSYGVSPVIEGETLFYDGYVGSEIGKVAFLDSLVGVDGTTQRMSSRVVTFGQDTLVPDTSGSMYAAFIVSVLPNSKHSFRDFFLWEGSTTSSFNRGRVFAKVSDDNADLTFAVSKNSSSSGVYIESEVLAGGVEVYHLLVLKYEVVAGDANDIVSLYINPDPTKTEAEQTPPLVAVDAQSDYSATQKIKINLRQRAVGAYVGGIRVGRSWEAVLQGESVSVTGVTLDKETLALDAGTTGTLVATVAPGDATDASVTWSSDNEAVATVADGVVTAVARGDATITVTTTDGSFAASCVVTVTSTVGIKNVEAKGFSVYPNPVSDGVLFVKLSDTKNANIEFYNVVGVLVHRERAENKSLIEVNTSNFPAKGVYFVKVSSNSGSHIEKLMIK